ncbi:MAG TPA: type II secretion system F family protein [Terriglobales bacterium]|nr:type II secretion system F family protein [Terriglobales bacterium]
MAEFLVKMADERGHVLQQLETGRSEVEVRERVAQQGFLVYSVRPRGVLAPGGVRLGRRRIKHGPFVVFNQQFLTLIHAGLPILTAIDLLLRRQRDARFRAVLENVRERLKSGEPLSEAFASQGLFPSIYTTTLLAGEKSGNLEEVLGRYIAYQRLTTSFRKKLLASLVYPALLLAAILVMLTFLLTYVVPRFAELFATFHADLPPLTVFMISVGTALRMHFVLFLGGIILLGLGLWWWKQSERGGRQFDRLRRSLPVAGEIWLRYQVAMFARTLATLLSGGLPLVPSLETAAASIDSPLMSAAVRDAGRGVREGRPLSASLEDTHVFPDLAVEMIEVGESTGALPAMLNSLAEFFEEDVQTAMAAAMSLVEPMVLIVMALVVAFVLISLYLPIFSLGAGAAS